MSEQLRIRVPDAIAAKLMELPPSSRSTAVAALLVSASGGVDLPRLLASVEEIRRVGVLLNQALRLAYKAGGSLDEETSGRMTQALNLIHQLRGDA